MDAKYLGMTANKLARIASELDAENTKLRELVGDMWNDAVTRMDFVDRHEFIGEFVDRMRELEVEA